jgi:Kef-type K+ transport system membrane component KefB
MPSDASPGDRNLLRVTAVYVTLVGVPSLLTFLFLDVHGGAELTTTAPNSSLPTSTSTAFARLLLAMAVILASCAVVGALLRRIRQPAVIGEILVGVLLGSSVLGAVRPEAVRWLFPTEVTPTLAGLAQLGVILFVFVAGMELDTGLIRTRSSVAVVVSHVSIAVPFLMGVALATVLHDGFAPEGIGFVPFALFLGVSMSVTALPVMARILSDLHLMHTEVGAIALTCALVDDVTAWSLLALAVAFATFSSTAGFLATVTAAVVFTVVMAAVVRPLLRRLGSTRWSRLREPFLLVVLCLLLLSALATELIGIHAIFGAFVLGMVCPRDTEAFDWVRAHVGPLTTALLLPVFFVYSGLRTELGLLGSDPQLWFWCLAILAVAILGKLGGSAVAARAVGLDWTRSMQLGALMNCRGLTELVVLNIGLDLGVLTPTLFTMFVLMALVTTVMTSPMLQWLQRRVIGASIQDPADSGGGPDHGPGTGMEATQMVAGEARAPGPESRAR